MTLKLAARAYRAGEIVSTAEDSREVEISFSSETPVQRSDMEGGAFWEVLGHADGEVDLSRLNSGGAPLLKDHMPTIDAQVGVVRRAWIEGGRGRAVVRFSSGAASEDVLARVRSGDVTCVSVGYGIASAERDGEADGLPIVRVTRWVPREISFVAIPADPSVGYGRAEEGDVDPITVQSGETEMPNDNQSTAPQAAATAAAEAPQAAERQDADKAIRSALEAERVRVAEIEATAEKFDAYISADDVRKARDKGMTPDAFRKLVLDKMDSQAGEATRAGAAKIGLTDQEVRSFSLCNVIRYLDNPTEANRNRAAFEIEASSAAAERMGKDPEGVFVPADVLLDSNFARAQATTPASAGGNLVATDHLSGSFIGLLRNRLALAGLGVRMLSGLVGNIDIPKQTGGTTHYWIGEGDDATDSDATFGIVGMSPHTLAIATPITRRLLKQSTPDVEALIRADIIANAALALDGAALVGGGGANAPTSLRDRLVAAGAPRVYEYGAAMPDFQDVIALETEIAAANADEASMAYIYNARMSGHLKGTEEFSGTGRPIERGREVNGYARVKSNQVANGETFFGAWSDLIIGMWGGMDLRTDRATLAKSDGLVLRAFQDVDVAVRHLESFTLGQPPAGV